jgi:hypothetical protein
MADIRSKQARLFPEIKRFDSPKSAKAAMKLAWRVVVVRPRFWVFVAFYVICVPIGLALTLRSFGTPPFIPPAMYGGLIGGGVGGTYAAVFHWLFRSPIRRRLREELVKQGVPICIPCGYDLRGQSEPRCPECGAAFDASLLKREDLGVDQETPADGQ